MYGGRPFWWVVKDVRLVGHPPKRATYTKTLRWLKSATVDEVRTKLRPSFLRNSSTFATLRWTRPQYLQARSFDLRLTHPPSLRYDGRGLNNCNPVFELSFAHCSSEIHWEFGEVVGTLDGTKGGFVFLNIVFQRSQQSLGVLGCDDDPRLYLGLGNTWHQPNKIDYKFTVGVGNHGQVGVHPLGNLLGQLNVDLILRNLFFFVCHNGLEIKIP